MSTSRSQWIKPEEKQEKENKSQLSRLHWTMQE